MVTCTVGIAVTEKPKDSKPRANGFCPILYPYLCFSPGCELPSSPSDAKNDSDTPVWWMHHQMPGIQLCAETTETQGVIWVLKMLPTRLGNHE